jgi:hypothetical protein
MNAIPFKFDLNDGMVSFRGTAFLDGDDLVIEGERKALDLVPIGRESIRIPAEEIERVEVESAMVGAKLIVRPFEREVLAGFPGAPTSEIVIPVGRKHREEAESLARALRLRNLPR